MGREAECEVQLGARRSHARVLLETATIIIRGELRATVPFGEMTKLVADDRALRFRWKNVDVSLALGSASRAWATKIERPPSVLDKLGVKPDHTVVALGDLDETFLSQLAERCTKVSRRISKCDLALVRITQAQLADVGELFERLAPGSGMWIVRRRGDADLSEARSREACRATGLVDVKTARFSESLTADKYTGRKG